MSRWIYKNTERTHAQNKNTENFNVLNGGLIAPVGPQNEGHLTLWKGVQDFQFDDFKTKF